MPVTARRAQARLPLARAVCAAVAALSATVFLRSLLPLVLTRLLNRLLKKAPPYQGSVEDARIDFWNGRLVVRGVHLTSPTDNQAVPAANIEEVSVQLNWKQLFRGALVASADIEKPLILVRADAKRAAAKPTPDQLPEDRPELADKPEPGKTETDPAERWNRKVTGLFPIKIDHVAIRNGAVHVRGVPGQNGTDLRVEALNLRVENVTNSARISSSLAARIHADARVMGTGQFILDGQAFPLADDPTFEVDAALDNLDLTELSGLIRASAATHVKKGELTLKAEAAAAEGRIHGYAKPVIQNLEAVKEGGDGAVKGAVLRNLARFLQNSKGQQIAARIPFEGRLEEPEVSKTAAIKSVLSNAFSAPISPGLEHDEESTIATVAMEASEEAVAKARKPSRARIFLGLFKESISRWSGDQAPRMGASLSYYTVFSLAPLLLLAISIAGMVFGREAVQGRVVEQMGGLLGLQGAEMLQSMIQAAAENKKSGGVASVISVIALLMGASAMMTELKFALNKIWRVKARTGLSAALKDKFLSVGMVLVLGFLLLVSLVASAGLAAASKYLGNVLPIPDAALHALDLIISFTVFTAMFAAMFKALPDAKIRWRDVGVGAFVTALLFVIGKFALGAYLGRGAVGSSYGAAGSLLVVLMWIYYSAQILYLGAEFTKVYADKMGAGVKPSAAGLPEKLAY